MKPNREDSLDVSATQAVYSYPEYKRLALGDMSIGQGGYVPKGAIHHDGSNYWCRNVTTVVPDIHPSESMYVYIERREGGYSIWIPEFGDWIRTAPNLISSFTGEKTATMFRYNHTSPGLS